MNRKILLKCETSKSGDEKDKPKIPTRKRNDKKFLGKLFKAKPSNRPKPSKDADSPASTSSKCRPGMLYSDVVFGQGPVSGVAKAKVTEQMSSKVRRKLCRGGKNKASKNSPRFSQQNLDEVFPPLAISGLKLAAPSEAGLAYLREKFRVWEETKAEWKGGRLFSVEVAPWNFTDCSGFEDDERCVFDDKRFMQAQKDAFVEVSDV